MFNKILLITLCISSLCASSKEEREEAKTIVQEGPWLTGPLLTPSGHIVPIGHYNFQPYIFYNDDRGYFNNHWKLLRTDHQRNINLQFIAQTGLTKKMDLVMIPQYFYNMDDGEHTSRFGDLFVEMGIELIKNSPTGFPDMKIAISESFPTGEYNNLDAAKNGTDASGGGSFTTGIKAVAAKLFHFNGVHYLATRLALSVAINSPVNLYGVNAYGNDTNTNGRLTRKPTYEAMLGLEYTVLQNIALALDVGGAYTPKPKFTRHTSSSPTSVGPTTDSFAFTVAPALEYNFNENIGIIGGVSFIPAGKSSSDFTSYILSINIYI